MARPVFEAAGHGRDVGEPHLGQEPPDLEIWVLSRFEMAEELENQPVPVHDRRVALFGLQLARLQRGVGRPAGTAEPPRVRRRQPPGEPLERSSAGDGVEQRPSEARIGQGVEQDPFAFGAPHPSDGRALRRVHGVGAALRSGAGERHGVCLGVPFGVLHMQEREVGQGRPSLFRPVGHDPRQEDRLDQLDGLDPAGLGPEPPARTEKGWHGLFQPGPARLGEDLVPRALHDQHGQHALGQSGLGRWVRPKREPREVVGAERQEIGKVADRGEVRLPEQLNGNTALVRGKVELDVLGMPGEVRHHQDRLVLEVADEGKDLPVLRIQELERAAAERLVALAQRDQALHEPEERRGVRLLGLDVQRLEVILGIDDHREVEPLRIGPREPRIAVGAPLHGRSNPVPVAQVDVVAHADLVSVVEDGRAWKREQQPGHHLDDPAIVPQQRRQSSPDAKVDAGLGVFGVGAIHVVAFLVRDHLERELVVVA